MSRSWYMSFHFSIIRRSFCLTSKNLLLASITFDLSLQWRWKRKIESKFWILFHLKFLCWKIPSWAWGYWFWCFQSFNNRCKGGGFRVILEVSFRFDNIFWIILSWSRDILFRIWISNCIWELKNLSFITQSIVIDQAFHFWLWRLFRIIACRTRVIDTNSCV